MRRVLDGFEQRAEKVVGWFDDRQIGGAVRFGLTLYTLAIPVFQNFQITTEKGWLWSWVVAVMLLIPFQRYQAGSYARRLARQIASINGSLAGSIEDIGRMLDGGKRLQEGQCNKVSTALLHRIKDFASLALNIGEKPKVRVTIAVPIKSNDKVTQPILAESIATFHCRYQLSSPSDDSCCRHPFRSGSTTDRGAFHADVSPL